MGNNTLSTIAYEKHGKSLLFRALGKHSCCPKYYRKITGIISLGGTLPVFDYLFLDCPGMDTVVSASEAK